jgi:hypothetical protein
MSSDEKTIKIKVLRIFEMNNFDFYVISIRDSLLPQKGSARYIQVFDRTVMKSSGLPIRVGPQLGFWT